MLPTWCARPLISCRNTRLVPAIDRAVRRRDADRAAWQADVARSEVRLQWDPDRDPHGNPVTRRAVQLGLRGAVLARHARDWIRRIDR